MANLSLFKVDSAAIEAGEWVRPGEEYDDLEIRTRGLTDAYTDARAARMRKAAISFNGDQAKIPAAISRNILIDCLTKHVVLDVRNLSDASGAPILFPAFCDLLRDPDYADLVLAVIKAATQVGIRKATDASDDAGNSAPRSA